MMIVDSVILFGPPCRHLSLLVVIWSYPEPGYNSATGHFM